MEDSFQFSLLRISIIQLLKAQGFDKCKPSTLNVITDLYIRMLTALVQKCQNFSNLRNDRMQSMDVLQGMVEMGLIKIDKDDTYNTKSVESLKNWLNSLTFKTVQEINQVPSNLKQTIVENRKFKNDINEQNDKQNDKQKRKQDFYNNFGQGEINQDDEDQDQDLDIQINWLNYLMEKDSRFSNKHFESTSLNPTNITGDYLVDNTTDEMNKYLPINIKYEVIGDNE